MALDHRHALLGIVVAVAAGAGGWFSRSAAKPMDYDECILTHVSHASNGSVAYMVQQACESKYAPWRRDPVVGHSR